MPTLYDAGDKAGSSVKPDSIKPTHFPVVTKDEFSTEELWQTSGGDIEKFGQAAISSAQIDTRVFEENIVDVDNTATHCRW